VEEHGARLLLRRLRHAPHPRGRRIRGPRGQAAGGALTAGRKHPRSDVIVGVPCSRQGIRSGGGEWAPRSSSPPRERSSRQTAPLTGLPSRAPHRNRFPWGPQAGLVRVGIVIDLGGIDLHLLGLATGPGASDLSRPAQSRPRPPPARRPALERWPRPPPPPLAGPDRAGSAHPDVPGPAPSRDRRRALPTLARGGLGMDPAGPRPLLQVRGCG